MSDKHEKPWYTQLPAKLAAVVVFLVAVTTLVGNVLDLVDERAGAPAAASPTRPAAAEASAPPAEQTRRLRLERIAVQHDGSPGTTDWRFTVEVDGDPLFAFQQEALDEQGGRNVAVPEEAEGVVRLASGRRATVVVKGWRGSWFKFGGEPDAVGRGLLSANGALAPVRVRAATDDGGDFVFHFSADRDDAR